MSALSRGNHAAGYNVIEMTITLFAFSVLAIAATGVFNTSQEILNTNYHQLILQKELRRVLEAMVNEIRESGPSSPNPISIGSDSITFQIPSGITNGAVSSWSTITYSLGPDTTVLRTVNGQNEVIGSSVSNLNFVYPADPINALRTVQIRVSGQRETLKRTIAVAVKGDAILRNS